MNIQLPDKFYKFLIFISLILTVFVYLKINENYKKEINSINFKHTLIDSLEINELKAKKIKDDLFDYAKVLSTRNNIKNPISYKDSLLYFNRIISSENKTELETNDLINLEWKNFKQHEYKMIILSKRIEQTEEDHKISNKIFDYDFFWLLILLSLISGILMSKGITSWYKQDNPTNNSIVDKNSLVFERCQSCYKKFSTVRNYSKNENQTINYAFCEQCFLNGQFTEKYKNVEDLYNELESYNLKKIEIKRLKEKISNLDRWKNKEY